MNRERCWRLKLSSRIMALASRARCLSRRKYHITVSISSKAKIFVRINFASFASQASRQLDKQDYLWSTYTDQTLQQNASLSGLSVKVLSWRWKLLHLVEISRHSSYPRGNLTSTISKSKVDSSQVQIIHAKMPHRLPNFVYFVDAQLISQIEM